MKFFHALILLVLTSVLIQAQTEINIYEPDNTPIANPERGLYHHTEVRTIGSGYSPLNLETLTNYREEEAITQILRVFYLEDFYQGLISQEYLDAMHQDFNTVRAASIKVIVRFAYEKRLTAPYRDATPYIVKNHIFQLREVLRAHSDVIATIQTGFIGSWGEWYYTDHFAGDMPWQISDENWADRRTVVDDLLRVMPKDRMIQIRTPGYKMTLFETEDPIEVPSAFNQTDITRVGHHNDCFVASANDFGTYNNAPIQKPYLEEETKYTPMGGETCALAPPYSDCENAYAELQRFHWSYLNIDYNNSVLNVWRDQGCFDDVELNLGYRYVLEEAAVETTVHPQGTFELSLDLRNQGFANFYNPRDLEIILTSITGDEIYRLVTDEDTRNWSQDEAGFTVDIAAGFPSDMESGTYAVYAALPDQAPALHNNPAYSVRFANQDNWDETTGRNDLGFEISVSTDHTLDAYSGDAYFLLNSAQETPVEGSTDLYAGTFDEETILFWGKSEQHETRRLERSADGETFTTLAFLPAENSTYRPTDNSLDYDYRFALVGADNTVSYSDVLNVSAGTVSDFVPVDINTDGEDEEWRTLPPTATFLHAGTETYALRTHFAATTAHFALYGAVADYALYLDTDNSETTGTEETDLLTGMDYKIEDGTLFAYTGSDWEATAAAIASTQGSVLEIALSHAAFENIGTNFFLPMAAILNNGTVILSETPELPAVHIRHVAPDLPENFDVRNSTNFPGERLEVMWDKCEFCDGYLLEKSDNGTDFYPLEDINADDEIYYHDFLPEATHYYRIRSYNILGVSDLSEVQSVLLSNVVNVVNGVPVKMWPNPVGDNSISVNFPYQGLSVYDVSGKLFKTFNGSADPVDISDFPIGTYLFIFTTADKLVSVKLIRQ